MALRLHPAPQRASIHLQARPIQPHRGDCVRQTIPGAAECGPRDGEAWARDNVRGQVRSRIWRLKGSLREGRGEGEEEAAGHVVGQGERIRKPERVQDTLGRPAENRRVS